MEWLWKHQTFTGIRSVIYRSNPEADRKILHDVLTTSQADVVRGWLGFGLPPTGIAVQPADSINNHDVIPDVQ